MRIAGRIIWTAYVAMALAVAVFSFLVQSQRMDIGSTMASVLLLGVTAVVITIALLSGSVMGTAALVRDPALRRLAPIVTLVAGWTGTLVLAWLSWSFWDG
jgi:hypothetical protein